MFRFYLIDEGVDEADWTLEEKKPFHKQQTSAAIITSVEYHHIHFPIVKDSKGKLFAITISTAGAKNGETVTVWLSRGEDRIAGHVLCRAPNRSHGSYGLQAQLISQKPAEFDGGFAVVTDDAQAAGG